MPVSEVTIWSPAIPMRTRFSHATAVRACAEPLIVGVELADHTIGYGETHPREYVTGESHESVVATIREVFVPILVDLRPGNFGEAIEAAANLPLTDARGRVISAARAAVELAVLDAYGRAFDRSLEALAGWLGESWLAVPGSRNTVRYSGVVSNTAAKRAAWTVRKMRLSGIRDFKLKVGDAHDGERLAAVVRTLGRGLEAGRKTLRLDANGAWTPEEAASRLAQWEELPLACVEQPLAKGDARAWATLARHTSLPLMADESLVTPDDAEALIVNRAASWFNIRISKNGGLIPAMRLAAIARRHDIACQLGCMVGETSILSAAGRWFLQMVPDVRFAEGSFGRFLLRNDVIARPIRFGYGGRWRPMHGPGLGVAVDAERLQRLCQKKPMRIPL